jgi:hypothetical protein
LARVAIILSSGRTGTQFLARYFDSNYREVVARHEPPPSRTLRICSNAGVAGSLSRERLLWLLRRYRGRWREGLGEGVELYIESNGFLYGFIEVLREVWPDVVVIHAVRDPRDAIRSSLNHGNARGLKRLAGTLIPHWLPDPRRVLGLEEKLGPVGLYAAAWTIINRTIRDYRDACPSYHLLRFDELVDENASGLRALCHALGLPFRESGSVSPRERINPSRLRVLPPWPEWSAEQCRLVEHICGPLMREYRYGGEEAWRAKLGAAP